MNWDWGAKEGLGTEEKTCNSTKFRFNIFPLLNPEEEMVFIILAKVFYLRFLTCYSF